MGRRTSEPGSPTYDFRPAAVTQFGIHILISRNSTAFGCEPSIVTTHKTLQYGIELWQNSHGGVDFRR